MDLKSKSKAIRPIAVSLIARQQSIPSAEWR